MSALTGWSGETKPAWHVSSCFDSQANEWREGFEHFSVWENASFCSQSDCGQISIVFLCYHEQQTRGGVWWAAECLPPQDPAAEQRPGGRKCNLFLDGETWREMTADRCVAIGGLWCRLTTEDWVWRWCSSASCRVSLLHGEELGQVQRLFGLKKTKKKERTVCIFVLSPVFSLSSSLLRGNWTTIAGGSSGL